MIPWRREKIKDMSIDDLIIGLQLAWDYIAGPKNDGRVTSDGSAELDYWLDEANDIWKEILRRRTS